MSVTQLQLDSSERPAAAPAAAPGDAESRILRFHHSERLLHWAIALPFLFCYATALVMVLVYNLAPDRPFRYLFSWSHRISGICLIMLPSLVAIRCRGDFRLHLYNIVQAWKWVLDDFKWMFMLMLSGISTRFELPEQGKFNAAEKVNFMVLMSTYPFYIASGLLIWLTHIAFLAWVLHFAMAMIATPLILGHMFMALISRSGRPGLQGMISGFVDRRWAKHHYRKWYREHHEAPEEPAPPEADCRPASSAPSELVQVGEDLVESR
jgi:formate dehydrogenase subunit gamma